MGGRFRPEYADGGIPGKIVPMVSEMDVLVIQLAQGVVREGDLSVGQCKAEVLPFEMMFGRLPIMAGMLDSKPVDRVYWPDFCNP